MGLSRHYSASSVLAHHSVVSARPLLLVRHRSASSTPSALATLAHRLLLRKPPEHFEKPKFFSAIDF